MNQLLVAAQPALTVVTWHNRGIFTRKVKICDGSLKCVISGDNIVFTILLVIDKTTHHLLSCTTTAQLHQCYYLCTISWTSQF